MISKVIKFIKKINPAFFVGLIFFIIPFFWYKSGTMDLGGDGTRLYFYDPINFIKSVALYGIDPTGKGDIDPTKHAYIIYVGLLAFMKFFINSPTFLIEFLNAIKLSVGFLSIYFIVREFIAYDESKKKNLPLNLAAIISGIFYVFSTASQNLSFFWVRALHSHDQVFLNPLVFFLTLMYLTTDKKRYILSLLFITFIFSIDFAAISAPSFFAFYPLAFIFLLLYLIFIRKKKIKLKQIGLVIIIFLGLQSFHLFPEIATLFHKGSNTNSVVFTKISDEVNFFSALKGFGKVSGNIFLPPINTYLLWISIIPFFSVIAGFLFSKGKKSEFYLISFFYLITLFLVSANITDIGYEFYKRLFFIPGFSMFRHFYIQWAFIYLFFYSLLFGYSLSVIFIKLKLFYLKTFSVIIILFFILGYWQFLDGEVVNAFQWGSNHVRVTFKMDPRYEQTLSFIRKLPMDGKILILPLSDNFNQVVFGLNDGAYLGPSSISFLAQRKSFDGYQIFYPNPIPDSVINYIKEKQYEKLTQLISLLNIRYVYYNSDPKIYEKNFNNIFPYTFMSSYMPRNQNGYADLIRHLPLKSIYKNGPYKIFEFNKNIYTAEIYIPKNVYIKDMIESINNKVFSYHSAFIDPLQCKKNNIISDFCNSKFNPQKINISFIKINPALYTISVSQKNNIEPLFLVFQASYDTSWHLFINGKKINENQHLLVNKYANGWIVTNKDYKLKKVYTISLILDSQKYFLYGLVTTVISLVVVLIICLISFRNYKNR